MADVSQITLFGTVLANLSDPSAASSVIDDAVFLNTSELAALVENAGAVAPELLGTLRETQLELVQSDTRDKSQQAQEKLARLVGGISADHWPKIFEGLQTTLSHPHVHRFSQKALVSGKASDLDLAKSDHVVEARLAVGRIALKAQRLDEHAMRYLEEIAESDFPIALQIREGLKRWEERFENDPLLTLGDDLQGAIHNLVFDRLHLAMLVTGFEIVVDIPQGIEFSEDSIRVDIRSLTDILINAFKYRDVRKETQRLKISWDPLGQRLLFSDNGIGIRNAEDIFKQDYRERPDYAEGSGIGLGFIRQTFEGRGWQVAMESNFGVGTTFIFTPPPGAFKIESLVLAKQLFWHARQISLDFYEAAQKLAKEDTKGLEKLIDRLSQELQRLGKLFPKLEDEKLQELITLLTTSSLTLPIMMRGCARQGLIIHPDSMIIERPLFGSHIYRVRNLQKELFDILKEFLQNNVIQQELNNGVWILKLNKEGKSSLLFNWPPDPENDIALKTYLELLGWTMTVDTSGEQIAVRIDFGENTI